MYVVGTYVAYLVISIGLTVWVARTLMKNGRVFLVDTFLENERLAEHWHVIDQLAMLQQLGLLPAPDSAPA